MKLALPLILLLSFAFAAPLNYIALNLDSADVLTYGNIFTHFNPMVLGTPVSETAYYAEKAFAKHLSVDDKTGFVSIPPYSVAYSLDLTYSDYSVRPNVFYSYIPFDKLVNLDLLDIKFLGSDCSIVDWSKTTVNLVSGTRYNFKLGETQSIEYNGKTYSVNVDYDQSQPWYSMSSTSFDPLFVTVTVDGSSTKLTLDHLTRSGTAGGLFVFFQGRAAVIGKDVALRIGGEAIKLSDGVAFSKASDWNVHIVSDPNGKGIDAIQLVYAKPLPPSGSITKISFPAGICALEYKPSDKKSYLTCGSATDSEQAKAPTISSPLKAAVSGKQVTFTWSTDEPADSAVKCSISGKIVGDLTGSDLNLATTHSIVVTMSDGVWFCAATSADDAGNKVTATIDPLTIGTGSGSSNAISKQGSIKPTTGVKAVNMKKVGFPPEGASSMLGAYNELAIASILIVALAFFVKGALKDKESTKRLFQWV